MTRHARLLQFLAVSTLVHAAAFWSTHHPLRLPAQMERQLTVSLETPNANPAMSGPHASFARPPRPVPKSIASIAPSRTNADAPRPRPPEQTQTSSRPPQASNPGSDAVVAAKVRAAIESELARYFVYPELARHYGWEGKVLLTFRVQADGHLDNIHVEKSCGYAVLDRSALQALHQVGRLVNAAEWLDGRAIDMHLPVLYRLEGNT